MNTDDSGGSLAVTAPFAGGIVVGVGSFLGGTNRLGDVTEIDADAGPGGGAAAHGVNKNVVYGKMLRGFRGVKRMV